MLENVVFDPLHSSTIYVAGWSVSGSGGGFFVTRDGGRSWSEPAVLKGKSIQAVAVADSDPRILIAGALDGLYRSRDRGENWERITPKGHPNLKNFESVAIDPRDPKIIYAGTWHLPWKTSDGGATWSNIKTGRDRRLGCFLDRSRPLQPGEGFRQRLLGHLQEREWRPTLPQSGGHTRKRATHPGSAPGSGGCEDGVCGNHGGALQKQRRRYHVPAHHAAGFYSQCGGGGSAGTAAAF